MTNKLMMLEKRLEAVNRELSYLEKEEQQSRVSKADLAVAFLEIRSSLKSGTLKTMKQLVDKYVQQVDIYPDKIVVKFNLFPHLRPDRPNDKDDQEWHSEMECHSFVDDGVPDSMCYATIDMIQKKKKNALKNVMMLITTKTHNERGVSLHE